MTSRISWGCWRTRMQCVRNSPLCLGIVIPKPVCLCGNVVHVAEMLFELGVEAPPAAILGGEVAQVWADARSRNPHTG